MPMENLPEQILNTLEAAGWCQGRCAESLVAKWRQNLYHEDGYTLLPSGRELLLSLGGLAIQQSGPGETCAVSSFVFDPELALGEEDRFAYFADQIGKELCPIGSCENGQLLLAISADGFIYALMDDIFLLGTNFSEALSSLILGRQPPTQFISSLHKAY